MISMGPRFRINIDYGAADLVSEAQTGLPLKVEESKSNALLEAAFDSVREKLGVNGFKKITIQREERKP
jgi:hypothetical protein